VAERLPAPKVEREMTATDATEPFSIGRNQFLMYIGRGVLLRPVLSTTTVPLFRPGVAEETHRGCEWPKKER
jgi:hypothetical protein